MPFTDDPQKLVTYVGANLLVLMRRKVSLDNPLLRLALTDCCCQRVALSAHRLSNLGGSIRPPINSRLFGSIPTRVSNCLIGAGAARSRSARTAQSDGAHLR